MLRSLMTAVTGVKAHQTMLDVTGNNIANVNTIGYKKDFTVFQDLLYQTSQGASGPSGNRGGINPAQVGLGVTVSAIETIHTQGPAQYTGNKSDMMINGDGFFVLGNGGSQLFTRAGAFIRDRDNNIVQSGTGYRLQGYKMERDPLDASKFVKSGELTDVNVPMGKKMAPRGTTQVDFQCNLDSRSAPYLPTGFEELPYNKPPCGSPATVKIGDFTFDMEFKTNPAADNGKGYLTIELQNGSENAKLVYDMVGVKDGRPVLQWNEQDSSSTRMNGTQLLLPVPGTTEVNMVGFTQVAGSKGGYDTTTGILDINGVKIPLFPKMHYKAITLTSADGATQVPMLAEFNEKPDQFASSPVKLTLWYADPTKTAADADVMHNIQLEVFMNPDGSFEGIGPKGAQTGERVIGLGTGLPDLFQNSGEFRIAVSESGKSLEFQAAKELGTAITTVNDPSLYGPTIDLIAQGGFHQTKKTIYDCQGEPHTLEVNLKKITENRWRWEAFLVDENGKRSKAQVCNTGSAAGASASGSGASGELSFCRCGFYCDVETSTAQIDLPFSLDGKANQTITLNFGGNGDTLNGITQFASETTTKMVYQDGYPMGVLKDYNVGKDGTIAGVYTNGQIQPIYRVALASFTNQQGLEKVGESSFIPTINSGDPNIDVPDSNGKGTITASTLEMSNVDLTEEFTRLIISQRGFQANTRVVTTSDQILEEVVNLKR